MERWKQRNSVRGGVMLFVWTVINDDEYDGADFFLIIFNHTNQVNHSSDIFIPIYMCGEKNKKEEAK